MTRDRTTEQRISDWLVGEGEYELPNRVLAETFHQAAVTRQVRALPPKEKKPRGQAKRVEEGDIT